jgi:primosomal protein N' (replication factor Y)
VAGRAGRRDVQGQVYIQTNQPNHRLFGYIQEGNYEQLFADEMIEREGYHYPPFTRLIKIVMRHYEARNVETAAKDLGLLLKAKFGNGRVLGPEKPLIERIRNQYAMEILIKLEKGVALAAFKKQLREELDTLSTKPAFKGVQIIVDVDCN